MTGEVDKGPRKDFFYLNDSGETVGLRYKNLNLVFAGQRKNCFDVWSEPFVKLRVPKLFSLRTDPFERADTEMSDQVATHEFPTSEAEEAFKIWLFGGICGPLGCIDVI